MIMIIAGITLILFTCVVEVYGILQYFEKYIKPQKESKPIIISREERRKKDIYGRVKANDMYGVCKIFLREYYVSRFLIELFKNTSINKNKAQLIFTTHSTNLLDLDLFRRDQIFFTEKNPKNGITDLYSLADFPVRNTENVEKGYLLGRYGAIPYIHPEDINE